MSGFYQSIIVFACLNLISSVGLQFLLGTSGLTSFGQAGFMAVGAYASGVLAVRAGCPWWLGLIAGTVISGLIALGIGFPTLKLRREYFVLATMGIGEAIGAIIRAFPNLTGGAQGLAGIPIKTNLLTAAMASVAAVLLVRNLTLSKYGRNSIALASDPLAAEAVGIDTFWQKQLAFVVSASLAGFAGALYAHHIGYIEPNMFAYTKSTEFIINVFFGGLSSITGTVLASFLMTALPEVLRFAQAARFVLYGAAILLVIVYRPGGMCGRWEMSWAFLRGLPARLRAKGGRGHAGRRAIG